MGISDEILIGQAWQFGLAPVQFPTGEKINLGEASFKARNPDRTANSKF
ncbi:MAG: hypothetical protein JGK17_12905 [Microcoleus sp. PH2017_10_PVI_O_A]|nr:MULTISPECIES: hypothetical protein [unclassified Microcoleus]MCC3406463.1 hypothetical protein [Microcoleus sp. PH2017_10_PVI_O_A]MCC3459090.1 hypothetical protein [Microcoleus sp. PH2017_11_PCY_U_A]MCC3478958.1 hypothetical protein [Microcoleus sp. PH2017_12_PCY_D_A]MCC3529233.1 hypothetical protein [Microcoleus sp. PH2017_21_RUC_O_A]MCC3541465.1 hypothetical protein [Microcoleus sp. PH2017_22_RUC_O_B]